MSSAFVFNQYYIDLLKKLKVIAKKHKDSSATAKKVLKSIKENYSIIDKSSDEYVNFIKTEISDDIWNLYLNLENDKTDDWIKENGSLLFFKNITLDDIVKLLRDNFLCNHYCSVFYIFKNNLDQDLLEKIIKLLQTFDNIDEINEIPDENIKKILIRLNSIKTESLKSKTGINMDDLKDTTIGKIAKEIIDDVDITKLQKSLSEEGNIFKAIAKPDSGFSELFTNVSQKMASKISSGELSQENIINDAVKFASVIPGLFNSASGNNGGGNNFSGMSNMMNMMNMMMKSNGGNSNDNDDDNNLSDLLKNMANNLGNKKGNKIGVNRGALKKNAKMKQLKAKLAKKNFKEEK